MKLGQFITEMKTTKETVRYYIDEQLITPKKVQGRYTFTEVDVDDFQNIRELREMGLPIRSIKKIKENKEYCGTKKQWESNYNIINTELLKVELEIETLNKERLALMTIREELKKKI